MLIAVYLRTARIIWHKPMIKKIGPLSILGTDKPTTEISRINISPKKSSLHSGEVTPSQKVRGGFQDLSHERNA